MARLADKIFRTTGFVVPPNENEEFTFEIKSAYIEIVGITALFRIGKGGMFVPLDMIEEIISSHVLPGTTVTNEDKKRDVLIRYTKGFAGRKKPGKNTTISVTNFYETKPLICVDATEFDEWLRKEMRKREKEEKADKD
jgi:hypothetical protein